MSSLGRKQYGVVYTPGPIVDLILDNVLPDRLDELANVSVCDPACGDGAFLTAVANRVLSSLGRSEALAVLGRMTGYDIDADALAACRYNLDEALKSWYPDERIDWNISVRNALRRTSFRGDYGRFTHVVGNPPYVRVQHLEQTGRSQIAGQWTVIRGATDLYLVFYELGLDLLRSGGTIGYITPSSWLRSHSGSLLRDYLVKAHRVKKIIDFGEHQLFRDVTTYTAITIVQKHGASDHIPVERYDGRIISEGGTVILDRSNPSKPWWLAQSHTVQERMRDLVDRGERLEDIADIHVGIQTLADGVFILPLAQQFSGRVGKSGMTPCLVGGETMWFEDWILRKIVKASVMKDGRDPVRRVVIFPYDDRGKLLSEERIAELAPNAYKWLSSNKERLLNRDKGRFDPARWYGFGRHVSIISGFGDKILTSGMNRRPNFQICPDPDATFYSGYCIKPKGSVALPRLLDALNSDDMDFFIKQTSRPYQGGWMSYAKSFIKDFPVPADLLTS